ncbi:MAG: hypothetical protein GH151_10385 [Bacteroidetes bacterium]|nr:hypothetical protein [Bacteroidota bacterium]
MDNIIIIAIVFQVVGVLFDVFGVLLIIYSDEKKLPLKPDSLTDIIGPLLNKDHRISPSKIFNDLFGHDYNKKIKRKKISGIGLILIGALIMITGLALFIIEHYS